MAFILKTCTRCGGSFGSENFSKSNSFLYRDGYMPICNGCIKDYLVENHFNWDAVDKLCQLVDIPFVPKVW